MVQTKGSLTGSRPGERRRGRYARGLIALAATALALLAVTVAPAGAKVHPIHAEFNDAVANLGSLKGAQLLDPTVPDPPATLDGTIDKGSFGSFTAPPEGFVVPQKTFNDVLVPGLNVTVSLTTDQPVTGTINPGTGALTADVNLNADIVLSGLLSANCHITGVPLHLATRGQLVNDSDPANPVTFDAAPFMPPSLAGAVVGSWDSLPPSTGDPICGLVDSAVAGPGGIWLSGTATIG
jgi:hypothetical protein